MYGSPPVFKDFDYPQKDKQMEEGTRKYICLQGVFNACKVPLICQVVHLIDTQVVKNTLSAFASDFVEIDFK